jgi:hypothetical protein
MSDKLFENERAKWVEKMPEDDPDLIHHDVKFSFKGGEDGAIRVGKIIETVLNVVAHKSLSAAMNGAMNDGGANDLMRCLLTWMAGLKQTIPDEFMPIMKHVVRRENPDEYEEYLRLKDIYGD